VLHETKKLNYFANSKFQAPPNQAININVLFGYILTEEQTHFIRYACWTTHLWISSTQERKNLISGNSS
jgi:hypothetical protein